MLERRYGLLAFDALNLQHDSKRQCLDGVSEIFARDELRDRVSSSVKATPSGSKSCRRAAGSSLTMFSVSHSEPFRWPNWWPKLCSLTVKTR
jgi:hypothetical protein